MSQCLFVTLFTNGFLGLVLGDRIFILFWGSNDFVWWRRSGSNARGGISQCHAQCNNAAHLYFSQSTRVRRRGLGAHIYVHYLDCSSFHMKWTLTIIALENKYCVFWIRGCLSMQLIIWEESQWFQRRLGRRVCDFWVLAAWDLMCSKWFFLRYQCRIKH